MNPLPDQAKALANKLGIGGVAALATGAVLIAGVTAVGAANGADDRPSASPVTVSVPGDDDGTPDQGSGDAPGTPGAPSTTVTSTTVTTTVIPPTTAPVTAPGATRTVPVDGVGVVVFDEATLGLVSATPVPGFSVRSESSARELHVRFVAPDGGRIDVQVEFEDGAVRVRVRDRRIEDGDSGRGRGGDDSSATTVPGPTPTVDDHGGDRDRDDRVEPGDDRDDDSSGHGSGGDDDHDDDRSGSGGGDDD